MGNKINAGKITKQVNQNTTSNLPQVQVSYLSRARDCGVANPYGTNSSAPVDSPCLVIEVGNPNNRVVIPLTLDGRDKTLKEGEFEAGNFKVGSVIKFKENGDIDVTSQKDVNVTATTCTIDAPNVIVNGNVTVNGNFSAVGGSGSVAMADGAVTASGDVKAGAISLQGHTHGGVQSGSSNTTPAQ